MGSNGVDLTKEVLMVSWAPSNNSHSYSACLVFSVNKRKSPQNTQSCNRNGGASATFEHLSVTEFHNFWEVPGHHFNAWLVVFNTWIPSLRYTIQCNLRDYELSRIIHCHFESKRWPNLSAHSAQNLSTRTWPQFTSTYSTLCTLWKLQIRLKQAYKRAY